MTTTVGTCDGRAVTWCHEASTADEEGSLSYIRDIETAASSQWERIEAKQIIAVIVQRPGGTHSTILYATENGAKDQPNASPLQSATLATTKLPSKFEEDFKSSQPGLKGHIGACETNSNFHIIISTNSGTRQATEVWHKLLQPALDYLHLEANQAPQVHFTESETSVSEITTNTLLPRANSGTNQLIVLLSGDGGLVDLANALLSKPHSPSYRSPTVALLPLGTGNAMAHSAKITADSTLGLSALFRGSARPVPLFAATFSPGARLLANEARDALPLSGSDAKGQPLCHGAVVCSWGLHASLVADSDTTEFRKHGAERFKMAANEALFPSDGALPHSYRGKVSVLRSGSQKWEALPREEHGYVLATLVSQLEAGFTVSPASNPLDGKLWLVHFGPLSGKEAMEIMTLAYQGGKHPKDSRVGYEEITGLRIEFEEADARWRRVCVDGKIICVEEGGWAEVRTGVEGVVDLMAM